MITSTKIYAVITHWGDDERAFTSIGAAYDYKDRLAHSGYIVVPEMIRIIEMDLEEDS